MVKILVGGLVLAGLGGVGYLIFSSLGKSPELPPEEKIAIPEFKYQEPAVAKQEPVAALKPLPKLLANRRDDRKRFDLRPAVEPSNIFLEERKMKEEIDSKQKMKDQIGQVVSTDDFKKGLGDMRFVEPIKAKSDLFIEPKLPVKENPKFLSDKGKPTMAEPFKSGKEMPRLTNTDQKMKRQMDESKAMRGDSLGNMKGRF